MAYQENYIVNNDAPDIEYEENKQPVRISQNSRYEESEEITPIDASAEVIKEIHETAVQEGLVQENEAPYGGEGNPKAEAVINDFISRDRPEAVEKKIEEYTEKKVKETRKIMATREILTGMTKRLIEIEIDAVLDIQQPDGTIEPELTTMVLKIKRLTESQVNHIFNRKMLLKNADEYTLEEEEEEKHFRSVFLSETVVDPQLTPDEWYQSVPGSVTGKIFTAVQQALDDIDNTELFR